MHVHLRPIVFQQVPAPRPVPKVAPSPVELRTVKRVAERPADGGFGSAPKNPDRRRPQRPPTDDEAAAPPRDPSASLALTLATLALAGLFGEPVSVPPSADDGA